MQQPTCTNLKIRSSRDAHKIFYAVRRGVLQLVTRRLDTEERQALRSGCVYAWEERGPSTEVTGLGIERFTEGRRWSPSRVRDEFLFYYEKWAAPTMDIGQPGGSDQHTEAPADWDPLVKQTYSVYIETDKGRRKWHLTAYFTQPTVDRLGTIDDIPEIVNVEVPEGMFSSTRATTRIPRSSRAEGEGRPGDAPRTAGQRTYSAYPVYEPDVSYIQAQQASQSTDSSTHGSRSESLRSSSHPRYGAHNTANSVYDHTSNSRPWYTPTSVLPATRTWDPSPSSSASTHGTSLTRDYGVTSRSTLERIHSSTSPRSAFSFGPSTGYGPAATRQSSSREGTMTTYNSSGSWERSSDHRSSLHHRRSSWSEPSLDLHFHPDTFSRSGETHSEGSGGSSPRSSHSEGGRVERDGAALVPLRSLLRNHPYRRDPMDDRLLRKLDPRTSTV